MLLPQHQQLPFQNIHLHLITYHTLVGIVLSVNHVLITTEKRSCNSMTVHVSRRLDDLSPQLPSAFAAISDTTTTETWFRYTPLFRGDAVFTRYRTRSLTASYILYAASPNHPNKDAFGLASCHPPYRAREDAAQRQVWMSPVCLMAIRADITAYMQFPPFRICARNTE